MAEATDHGAVDHGATLSHRIAEKADKIKYVIIAIVVVTAAAIALVNYQRRNAANKEAAAENKVFQTVIDLQAAPETDALAAFSDAAKSYAGLPAGERALVFKYSYAFNTRDFKQAEDAARDLLKGYPKSVFVNRAKLALAQALGMQDKNSDAVAMFRELNAAGDPEVLAESKLGLAQALEREAEKVKDDPDAYRRALEEAEAEYNDIIARSQITIPSQRGFWPQSVTMPADFALVVIKDKLAGHAHPEPRGPETPVTEEELKGVMSIRPPAETEAAEEAAEETPEAAEAAEGDAEEKAE